MAEATVEIPPSARFFCHVCTVHITPLLPDFLCPQCNGGFIEEQQLQAAATTQRQLSNIVDSDSDSTDSDGMDIDDYVQFRYSVNGGSGRDGGGASSSQGVRVLPRTRANLTPGTRRPLRRPRAETQSALSPLLHDLIMQMTSGVLEASVGGGGVGIELQGFPGMGLELPGLPMVFAPNLSSNPGDYVWGRGGLDAIITQLMNQLDGSGPPPLAANEIGKIASVPILQEQCDKGLQCPVCMDDFTLGETVRQLDCEHCYHDGCLVPWLELHGTCPVCRKPAVVHDANSSGDTHATTEPTGNQTINNGLFHVTPQQPRSRTTGNRSRNESSSHFAEEDLD